MAQPAEIMKRLLPLHHGTKTDYSHIGFIDNVFADQM